VRHRVKRGWHRVSMLAVALAVFSLTLPQAAGAGGAPATGTAAVAVPPVSRAELADAALLDATAALPDGVGQVNDVSLPRILDQIDVDRYRQIFRLQAAGDFRGADNIIGNLGDQTLLGAVLADRYLSPAYKAQPKELQDWLARYASNANADAIYALARKKAPGVKLNRPQTIAARSGAPNEGSSVDSPDFLAGLSAWRNKDFSLAAKRFAKAAEDERYAGWNRAAAAYWAARANLRDKKPAEVSTWLKQAAKSPRSFYGLLAARALGMRPGFDWSLPSFNARHGALLLRSAAGKRALALLQVGQVDTAERELLTLATNANDDMAQALFVLSQSQRMPSLALSVASGRKLPGSPDAALFPLPAWAPAGGFDVDPALVYAIIRQESGFNPAAVSPAGATGLMQLMPGTAKIMTSGRKADLKNPQVSIVIGQRYIARLLKEDAVQGDLFMLAAAYNAGPGNLAKWRANLGVNNKPAAGKSVAGKLPGDDPLLFIESLPSQETRLFVERVMANYWIYQDRLGRKTSTLDAVAGGAWPTYDGGLAERTASLD